MQRFATRPLEASAVMRGVLCNTPVLEEVGLRLRDGVLVIDELPAFSGVYNVGDVVSGTTVRGIFYIDQLIKASTMSNVSIVLDQRRASESSGQLGLLEDLGCIVAFKDRRFINVGIPQKAFSQALSLIAQCEERDLWQSFMILDRRKGRSV